MVKNRRQGKLDSCGYSVWREREIGESERTESTSIHFVLKCPVKKVYNNTFMCIKYTSQKDKVISSHTGMQCSS